MKVVFFISRWDEEKRAFFLNERKYDTYQDAEQDILQKAPLGRYQIEKVFVKTGD
ncbi:hypothetical protein [Emticicia aquatilis]|nr:hypothetical protein [Emticicia aquatilis]